MSDRLNFNLKSSNERLKLVERIVEDNDTKLVNYYDNHYNPHINQNGTLSENSRTSKDLEALANYLLYSSDSEASEDTITDYREKRNSRREASINKMINVKEYKKETNKSIMKVPKIKVLKKDREEFQELKTSGLVIDNLTRMIKTGVDSTGNKLEDTEIKRLKWMRTDIQKDEVAMKNELKKYIKFQSLMTNEKDHTALSYIQFDNPEIIRILVEDYSELKENSFDDTFGYMKIILFVLEELIEMTDLDEYIYDVMTWKIDGLSHDEMIENLFDKYQMNVTKPALSKLTRKTIPNAIVEAYKQQKEDWLYTFVIKAEYKTCNTCNKNLIANSKYFVPNKLSKSGLTSLCRNCKKNKYKNAPLVKNV